MSLQDSSIAPIGSLEKPSTTDIISTVEAETTKATHESDAAAGNTQASSTIEPLEIEAPLDSAQANVEKSRSVDEDDDLRGLLDKTDNEGGSPGFLSRGFNCFTCSCHSKREKVGNMVIFLPDRYYTTGWGIYGPHWYGPPCVALVIVSIASSLIAKCLRDGLYVSVCFCIFFTVICLYLLMNTAYRDPGLVRACLEEVPDDYLWCDLCENFQPPGGAHCPQCNVCVAGYDHHCVWMGTCIGKNNFRQFVNFNLSWLAYAAFAVVWILLVGPLLRHS